MTTGELDELRGPDEEARVGIFITGDAFSTNDNHIGSAAPVFIPGEYPEENVIAFNRRSGVAATVPDNAVYRNRIFSNGELGIRSQPRWRRAERHD